MGEAIRWGRHYCRLPTTTRRPPCIYTTLIRHRRRARHGNVGPVVTNENDPPLERIHMQLWTYHNGGWRFHPTLPGYC